MLEPIVLPEELRPNCKMNMLLLDGINKNATSLIFRKTRPEEVEEGKRYLEELGLGHIPILTTEADVGKYRKYGKMMSYLMGPHYEHGSEKQKPYIFSKGGLPILLHEVGHAKKWKQYDDTGKAKLMNLGRAAGMAIPPILARTEMSLPLIAAISAVANIPTLYDEGVASLTSLKRIREIQGKKAARKAMLPLGAAYSTYMLNARVAPAISAIARRGWK